MILLHGWPYDIYSFVDVAPLLASAGYRVIVPYVRGYGTTRFLSSDTFRAMASRLPWPSTSSPSWMRSRSRRRSSPDLIGERGPPTSSAALWPERCKAMVSVSGYLIGNQEAGKKPLAAQRPSCEWWYQFYFATERGRAGYDKIPARLCEAHLADCFAEMEFR